MLQKNIKKEFNIPFSGLKLGMHLFNFEIDNTFFTSFGYDDFNSAALNLSVVLNKMSTIIEVDITISGTVNVACDITNEPFDLALDADMRLIVKFGDDFNDEDDEILILPHGSHEMNIAQHVYETAVLAVPQKRVHPGIEDGTLESEALDTLKKLQPKAKDSNTNESDPRWDELKKLLTDK